MNNNKTFPHEMTFTTKAFIKLIIENAIIFLHAVVQIFALRLYKVDPRVRKLQIWVPFVDENVLLFYISLDNCSETAAFVGNTCRL